MTHSQFSIRIDRQLFTTGDPVITAAQLLELAGRRPSNDWNIVAVLPAGSESLRPTETFDLRKPGAEDFVTHHGDRVFTFVLDGVKHEWPAPFVDTAWLRNLADAGDSGQIYVMTNGQPDRLLDQQEKASLNGSGVEQFRSVPAISIWVNMRSKTILGRTVTFEQIVALAVTDGLQSGPNIVYTMTFSDGPGDDPEGIMNPGAEKKITKGMVFNVTATDKS